MSEKHSSNELARLLAAPDRIILRLNKLISTPGGLSTFLSNLNYVLYLLTYLESKSATLRARLHLPAKPANAPAGPSPIATAASLLSQTRTLLRCLGLFPMYAWARSLSAGPKPTDDPVLYRTAVAQCAFYTLYQLLENVAFLTDAKVLAADRTARWFRGSTTAELYRWSYRFWMLGIAGDFVRLARERAVRNAKRAKRSYAERDDKAIAVQDEREDAQFWADCVVPAAWFPMAFHYAEVNATGVPGWNLGWMGVSGLVASFSKAKAQWEATK